MPNQGKQKRKLLYLYEILLKETDKNKCYSAQELIDILEEKDIYVERKTIYSDIQALKDFGLDVRLSKSKDKGGYYVEERDFELAELKIIVEAILSSRYISAKRSKDLIHRLESLVGPSEQRQLEREVFVSGRIKTQNESIFINADILHNAMLENREISFAYLEWTKDKELLPRKDGKLYRVSPWALTVKDENYYLIAYDAKAGILKHYRVDKMKDIKMINRSQRQGNDAFSSYDVGEYTNQNFGMFSGEADIVSLLVPENKVGIIFDRFGKDISVRPYKGEYVSCRIPIIVSPMFFGWLTGLGKDIKISGPESVKNEYIRYLSNIVEEYK